MIYDKYDREIDVLTWFSSADMNTKLLVQVSKIDKYCNYVNIVNW